MPKPATKAEFRDALLKKDASGKKEFDVRCLFPKFISNLTDDEFEEAVDNLRVLRTVIIPKKSSKKSDLDIILHALDPKMAEKVLLLKERRKKQEKEKEKEQEQEKEKEKEKEESS